MGDPWGNAASRNGPLQQRLAVDFPAVKDDMGVAVKGGGEPPLADPPGHFSDRDPRHMPQGQAPMA